MKNPYKSIRTWLWKRKVNRAIRILDALDWSLKNQSHWKRHDRRRFWEEFHRNPKSRTAILNKMTQG